MGDRPTESEAARQFDINTPEMADDPWAAISALRDTCPVLHSDRVGWVVAGYPGLWEAARDTRRSAPMGSEAPRREHSSDP